MGAFHFLALNDEFYRADVIHAAKAFHECAVRYKNMGEKT